MKQDTGIHQMVQKVNKISNLKTLYFDLKTLKSRVHDEKTMTAGRIGPQLINDNSFWHQLIRIFDGRS
jgi:hypothetical protein